MKKTLFNVIVYIFCVFSIVDLYAEENKDDLEKTNFLKIERLQDELSLLKEQFILLTEQERLNIKKESESEGVIVLETQFIELNTKVNSLNNDILALKNEFKLLAEEKAANTQEQSELEGGLDLDIEFLMLKAKVNSLNDDISIGFTEEELEILSNDELIEIAKEKGLEDILVLDADGNLQNIEEVIKLTASTLKEQYELLKEQQRFNTQKINELFEIIELNATKKQKTEETIKTDKEKIAFKLYSDGKNQFVLGNYKKAIGLFLNYLEDFPNSLNTEDSKLWLGRAYFYSESYLKSKTTYLDFQFKGQDHPKYADSLYELARVLVELKEVNDAKLILNRMIEEYPEHSLTNKASQLLQDL